MKKWYKFFIIFIAIWIVVAIVLNIKLDKINNRNSSNEKEVTEKDNSNETFNSKFKEQGEMRGVWLSTVNNLDWPEVGSYNNNKMQQELLKEKLDFIEDNNMNTVFFQVRPMGDALYESEYSPWSKYLTGELGKDPGYDPLEFAIKEAHKRGIEIQAWFNPFRID
ncbi:glycoside hydrolase family 10 protein, partial [uncultured Clostridium sp.]